jgi:hypothetical protein
MRMHLSVVAIVLSGCSGHLTDAPSPDDSVRVHGDYIDPWTVLERERREGPPRYTSRVHGCTKMRYATIGNVLASRGVAIGIPDPAPLSAAQLYRDGAATLGAPNLAARVRETLELGVATSSKLFDLFVQAAPEIIAQMPTRPECQVGGVGVELFDAANRCVARGITCLIGMPATAEHVAMCDHTVSRAETVEIGKQLAVAVLAAAAHTCE